MNSSNGDSLWTTRPLALSLFAAFVAVLIVWGLAFWGTAPEVDDDASASLPQDLSLVERGAYVAIAANCVSCHTRSGGQPFAGGLAFHTPFGIVHSTNITPDAETGIGDWSYQEFERSMRRGIGDGGEHLYPVFPYTSFTKMTDDDMRALFAFFQDLTPIRSETPLNEMSFPFNQRWLLAGWKMLFLKQGQYERVADQSAAWNRGKYLVDSLAHCAACHSPRNALGAKRSQLELSGGVYTDRVPSGDYRTWSAPNLTQASTGLGEWTADEIVDYLKQGKNTHAAVFGPMNEVFGNSTQYLNDADVEAIAAYLKSLPPIQQSVRRKTVEVTSDQLGRGQTIYNIHCGTCHQPTGLGAPETGARLANSPIVQADDPSSLLNVIIYGAELPDPWPPIGDWKQMPSFNDKLKDDEIAALATYLRQEWGHSASAVTVEEVAAQRPPFDTPFKGYGE